ncbi:MAG: SHD1 domain-containing protein [Planctomycetota bacterium]
MNAKSTLFVVLFCLLMSSTSLLADTWTSANGQFKIEAQFLQLKDGRVQLKRDDNQKTIWVDLDKLSKADQAKAQRLAKGADEQPMTQGDKPSPKKSEPADLLKSIKLTAKAQFEEFAEFDENGKELPKNLKVIVTAKGKPAATAFLYGKLKLDDLVDGDGNKIKLKSNKFSFNDITKELVKIDRGDDFFSSHPKDGVAVELVIPGDSVPKKIATAKGSFKISTGGERELIKFENLESFKGGKLENKSLKAAGIQADAEIKSEQGGTNLSVNLKGKLTQISMFIVGDPKQNELDEQNGFSSSGDDNFYNHSFYFDAKELPKNTTLFIEVVNNPVQLDIPFDFENIKMPKAAQNSGRN